MKYKILRADGMEELTELVQMAIEDDWTPLGGVSNAGYRDEGFWCINYAQSMVKEWMPQSPYGEIVSVNDED